MGEKEGGGGGGIKMVFLGGGGDLSGELRQLRTPMLILQKMRFCHKYKMLVILAQKIQGFQ